MAGCIDALKTAAERSPAVFDQETNQRLMAQLLACDEQVRGQQRASANEPACVLPAAPQQPRRALAMNECPRSFHVLHKNVYGFTRLTHTQTHTHTHKHTH